MRSELGLFLAEGPQAVREAVAADAVTDLFVTADAALRHPDLVANALAGAGDVIDVDNQTLAALTDTVSPQGLIAVARMPRAALAEAVSAATRLAVVLVEAQDPGNVGTVIRIADAAGADAVILTEGSVDPFNGKSVRASAGSVFHLPIVTGVSVQECLAALSDHSIQTIATSADGTEELFSEALGERLAAPVVWLFGNEARGLPHEIKRRADLTVRIPIYGQAESLNLAAAATLAVYASAAAQRR